MAVPWMRSALRGWTERTQVDIITQSVVNHQTVETISSVTLDINLQPMPAEAVNRKPQGQRAWKWWSYIIKGDVYLKPDSIIVVNGDRFRIEKTNDWRRSGFTKGEAVEDYSGR